MKPTTLETPCSEWQGALSTHGYGVKWCDGRQVGAHRWVVAQILGWEALKGKVVRHRCDNPACFRYDHLLVGTQSDNMLDMHRKGRHKIARRTHCQQGHEYTEENTRLYAGRQHCRTCHRLYMRERRARS